MLEKTAKIYVHGENDAMSSVVYVQKFIKALFILYIFLSYFEIYLSGYIGTSTKYLMLLIMGALIYLSKGKVKVSRYWLSFFLWFVYWCISIAWAGRIGDIVKVHFLSQIGIVLFIMTLDGQTYDEAFIRLNLQGHLWCSALFGVLSILFHRAYFGGYDVIARQVLTLFGRQNDPNNCAAFLLVGIALAAYSVLYEKRHMILSFGIIAINSYATLLTGSRAGLVGIGLIAVVFVFLPSRDRKFDITGGLKKLFFMAVSIVVVVYLVNRFLPVASLNRLLAFNEYQSGSGRMEKWGGAFSFFLQRPILGWGWGGLNYHTVGLGDSAHNTYLSLLCEGGIIGFCIFLFPLVSLIFYAFKTRNVLILILLICGLFPSFFIDAINKRFLWNAIIVSILITNYYRETKEIFYIWNPQKGSKELWKKSRYCN